MEYQLLKRTKFSGSTPDSLAHQKTAKTLKKAIEYKIALENLLEDYEKDRASFEICIKLDDAFKYVTEGSEKLDTEEPEEEVKDDKIINF
tara:strand:- start:37 stop:306 length:270 start_codon:yes stop_codon:yes gene_type:complete